MTKAEIEEQIKTCSISLYEAYSLADLYSMILSMDYDLNQIMGRRDKLSNNTRKKLQIKIKYIEQVIRVRTNKILGDLDYED